MSSKLMLAFNRHIVSHLRNDIANMPKFGPDKFQLPIIEKLISSRSINLFADAVAGGGKSTLIKFACAAIKGETEIKTSSAHGFKALRNKFRVKPINGEDWKYANICEEVCKDEFTKVRDAYKAKSELRDIVSSVMSSLTDPKDRDKIYDLIIANNLEIISDVDKLISLVPKVINEGLHLLERYGDIGFIDMLYWPIVLDLDLEKFEFVLADEAQDFNAIQIELTKRSIKDGYSSLTVADEDQSMYGFAGALPDSCEKIIRELNCEVMPLSFCYRCPTTHLDLARQIVPKIQNSPFAKEGRVDYTTSNNLHRIVTPDTMILCRFTAPLISTCIKLIGQGIGATVRGSEIGKSLVKIIDNCEEMEGGKNRISAFPELLRSYRDEQFERLGRKKNQERQLAILEDKCLALNSAFDGSKPTTFDSFKKYIESLFSEKKGIVTLSTVHRAKGLEADKVIVLDGGKSKMPVNFPNSVPWEQRQERNIKYVALTRSKDSLTIITDDVIASFDPATNDPSLVQSVATASIQEPAVIHLNEKPVEKKVKKAKVRDVTNDHPKPIQKALGFSSSDNKKPTTTINKFAKGFGKVNVSDDSFPFD